MEETGLVPDAEELEIVVEPDTAVAPTLDEMVAALAGPDVEADAPVEAQVPVDESGSEDPEGPERVTGADDEPSAVEVEEPDALPVPLELPVEPLPIARRMWTRAPLWVVMGAFVVLVSTIVYLMWPLATGAFTSHPLYSLFVIGGAVLVLLDLVTGCAIWLSARSRAQDGERAGLAAKLWIRTLSWTAGGVALWWMGVALLDLRHAGIIG